VVYLILALFPILGVILWATRIQLLDEASRENPEIKFSLRPGIMEEIRAIKVHRRLYPHSSKRVKYGICLVAALLCFIALLTIIQIDDCREIPSHRSRVGGLTASLPLPVSL
jgi:hypothetical protein